MVKPPCFDRNGMKKGAWSKEEDDKLRAYVLRYGHWNWRLLPKYAGLQRCGKSCRLRWVNYLKPGLKRGNFSKQEQLLVIKLHAQLGNKWSAIASKLPGRTDNEIKNFWHTRVQRPRKSSSSVVKAQYADADAFAGGASKSCKAQPLEEDKPSEARNEQRSSTQEVSFDTSKPSNLLLVDVAKPISTTVPSSVAKSSDELSASTDEAEVEVWPDIFLPDTTNDSLVSDYCLPQLEDPEYNNSTFHPEFHQYVSCSELSSSDTISNHLRTAHDEHYWIGDDMVAVSSSDDLWGGIGDSFASSNNAWNSPLHRLQDNDMRGEFYDALLQYCCFDDGTNLFG